MNFKTTVVLIVLLCALGSFVFLMKDRSPSYTDLQGAKNAAAQGSALFNADQIKASWVDTMTLTTGDSTAKLSRANDEWLQVEPVHFSLSKTDVQEVIDAVVALKSTEQFTPGKGDYPEAQAMGLQPPKAQITLAGSGEHVFSHQIKVGRTIVGGKLYVMLDADPKVYVVSDELATLLADKPVHRWRIATLLAPGENQAMVVTILNQLEQAATPKIQVQKQDGKWQLSSPDQGRADRQAVASLLNDVKATQITRYIADAPANLSDYGLSSPQVELTILSTELGNGKAGKRLKTLTHNLKIGAPADLQNSSYYATWTRDDQPGGAAVFTIDKKAFERFTRSVDALRDPALTPLAEGEIKHLSLKHQESQVAFTRSAKGWEYDTTASGRNDYLADDGSVSKLVAALAGQKAITFVPSQTNAASPLATVTLTGLGQSSPDVLRIWVVNEKNKEGKAQWLVVRNDESVGRVVLAESVAGVLAPGWMFRDRELADLPAGKINRIAITQADGSKVELARSLPTEVRQTDQKPSSDDTHTPRDTAGPWHRVNAGQSTQATENLVDPTLPAAIVSGMSPLRVTSWRAPEADFEVAQGQQACDLVVTASDGQSVHLKMNEQGHAQLDGQAQTFVLQAAIRDAIKASYGKPAAAEDAAMDMGK